MIRTSRYLAGMMFVISATGCGKEVREYIGCTWDVSGLYSGNTQADFVYDGTENPSPGYSLRFLEDVDTTGLLLIDEFPYGDLRVQFFTNGPSLPESAERVPIYLISREGFSGQVMVYGHMYFHFLVACELR